MVEHANDVAGGNRLLLFGDFIVPFHSGASLWILVKNWLFRICIKRIFSCKAAFTEYFVYYRIYLSLLELIL